jgi:hypothetical protein
MVLQQVWALLAIGNHAHALLLDWAIKLSPSALALMPMTTIHVKH